jgi:hypothetical protein
MRRVHAKAAGASVTAAIAAGGAGLGTGALVALAFAPTALHRMEEDQ